MTSSSLTSPLKLEADDVEDLIYLCRTGDLAELKETLASLSQKHNTASLDTIIQSAIDVDDDGLGSQSCLLHYPAANGNMEVLAYLLQQISTDGQDVNSTNANGLNGVHPSSNGDVLPPSRKRAFINHRNVSGNTPLHWAAMNGHLDAVKALVQAGADPTLANGAGRDAVVEAEWSAKDGSEECVNWMLQECAGLMRGVGGQESAREVEAEADKDEEERGENSGNTSMRVDDVQQSKSEAG